MRRVLIIFVVIVLPLFLSITSCRKNKEKTNVTLYARHHGEAIPGAVVYVKYNSADFPGADVSVYNGSATCDDDGKAYMENLEIGEHYFYATGFDSSVMEKVSGGISLTISKSDRGKTLTLDVPITE